MANIYIRQDGTIYSGNTKETSEDRELTSEEFNAYHSVNTKQGILQKYTNLCYNYAIAKAKRDLWDDPDYQSLVADMYNELDEV